MSKNPSSDRKCPRCAKNSLLNDDVTGERFCGKCGYVVSEKSQESEQEWRSFTQDEYGNKTELPSQTMNDMRSSTIINPVNKDASGKPLSASMTNTIGRLRKYDTQTKNISSADKNLNYLSSEIGKLKKKLALSDAVIEKTIRIYRNTIEKKLSRGYTIQGLIGACLYAACKETEIPRTTKDISNNMHIHENDVLRCYKLIVRELELTIPVSDPIKHVSRIASIVGLSEKSKRKAVAILEQAKKSGINVGKEPMGIIAAALYLAGIRAGEIKSQKVIAIASGVTEVTIRKRCKDITAIIEW